MGLNKSRDVIVTHPDKAPQAYRAKLSRGYQSASCPHAHVQLPGNLVEGEQRSIIQGLWGTRSRTSVEIYEGTHEMVLVVGAVGSFVVGVGWLGSAALAVGFADGHPEHAHHRLAPLDLTPTGEQERQRPHHAVVEIRGELESEVQLDDGADSGGVDGGGNGVLHPE